jgi:hypothetical protein
MPSLKFSIKLDRKKLLLFFLLIMGCISCLFLGFFLQQKFFSPMPNENTIPTDDPATAQKKATVDQTSQKVDIAQIYPFVSADNANISTKIMPEIAAAHQMANNTTLPAIPTMQPRPNVSSIPIPNMPPIPGGGNNQNTSAAHPVDTSHVQGIFTGNDGNNIAIMSDGKIVQEGDSYQDNRISYIGGNGIHFENGNTISYK